MRSSRHGPGPGTAGEAPIHRRPELRTRAGGVCRQCTLRYLRKMIAARHSRSSAHRRTAPPCDRGPPRRNARRNSVHNASGTNRLHRIRHAGPRERASKHTTSPGCRRTARKIAQRLVHISPRATPGRLDRDKCSSTTQRRSGHVETIAGPTIWCPPSLSRQAAATWGRTT
jgi:hypothetical protein